jgi:acetyl esterase/lipase
MPPVLAIIGDRDELIPPEFQRNFAARLSALHVRNVAIELPWSSHAFDAANGLGAGIAHDATLRFLDALL